MLAYAQYISDARIKSYVKTLEREGHQVDVIALRAEGETEKERRSTGTTFRIMDKYQGHSVFLYIWSYWKFFMRSALLLIKRSFRHKYDVIHIHNMPNALVFAAIGPKLLGAKLMLDVHDIMAANYMAKFTSGKHGLAVYVFKLEQRFSAMLVDQVFCADHNQQDYLVEQCGIPREKITVMMNLPSVGLFKPATCQRGSEVFRLVYHGTIAHRLGIDLIVRAVARAAERIPVELWLYGAGDYLPEVIALAAELGIEQKVHFSNKFFPVEQIPEIVCGMDLGIIGNRRNLACDRYMLPVKLLEYVYLGVSVLAPRLSVIERYFNDQMVRFYEPENLDQMSEAIVELFHDAAMRKRLAVASRSFYQQHNIEAQAERYLNLVTSGTGINACLAERHS
jgi:glycosyltransferase involved in cell wall biosynthesis